VTWRDPYEGLLDGVAATSPLRRRRLFHGWAYYVGDRLVWVSVQGRAPWRGILVPTERAHHAALRTALPALRPHPVLGKWLYLPARRPDFEAVADALAQRIADGDALIGVIGGGRVTGRRRRASVP
jgi:hypothetical protein